MPSGFLMLNILFFRATMNIMCEMYINYYKLINFAKNNKKK